ncbi:MAG: hypothetical protein Q8936_18520 [Bacillota bacterium]|nr:hypothetical protein [Bacillota bacterium]
MLNLFWYIGLAGIGVASSIYAVLNKRTVCKTSTLLVLYLFTAGVAWIGEFTVLGLFNAYLYKTGVFADIWEGNLLGHLILNTTLYPAAAVIMAAYSFRYGWISFISIFFTSIEYLFVKLRIYEQHWWRYYMTAVIVFVILVISNKVFKKMNEGCSGLVRAIIFYFPAMVIIHIPAPILLLLGKQQYRLSFVSSLVKDFYLSSIIIIFSFHVIECLLAVIFACILKKWYWKSLSFIISIVVQSVFAQMGILTLHNGWRLIYTLFFYEISIMIFFLLEKYTVKPDLSAKVS